jgi:hypothetical protein
LYAAPDSKWMRVFFVGVSLFCGLSGGSEGVRGGEYAFVGGQYEFISATEMFTGEKIPFSGERVMKIKTRTVNDNKRV